MHHVIFFDCLVYDLHNIGTVKWNSLMPSEMPDVDKPMSWQDGRNNPMKIPLFQALQSQMWPPPHTKQTNKLKLCNYFSLYISLLFHFLFLLDMYHKVSILYLSDLSPFVVFISLDYIQSVCEILIE